MEVIWVVILVVATLILVGLGLYAWSRRATPGVLSFSLLMFAVAVWSLAYALELLSQGLSAKMLWIKVEYVGIAAMPALWLAFVLQYTGRGRWLSRRNVALLAITPVITVLLVWTNEAHHLFYRLSVVDWSSGWPLLHIEYGPWFWVNALFTYVCMLLGTLLLGEAFFHSSSLHRGQAGMLLLGALIPWVGNAIYLTGLVPWPDLDPTPLAFALSGLVLAYGLFRYKLLQVVPVAQRAVIDGMPTAMIVLDSESRIADLNPAARRLFDLADREVIGQPARQVLWPGEVVQLFAGVTHADRLVERGEGDDRQAFRVTISPLDDQSASVPARLVLIEDVTEQVRAKETLEQTNRQLLALQESTAALTALLDPADLFERVMDQLDRLLPYKYAALGLYDEPADRLTFVVSRGFGAEELAETERTALERHPGWVVRHKLPLLIHDTESDPRARYLTARRSRSLLMVPIVYQDRCLGLLGLGSLELAAYTPADQDLLLAFANEVAVAVENARLFETEQIRRRQSTTLQEVGRLLTSTLSVDQVLDRILEQLERVTDYEGATVTLLRKDRLEVVAVRGFADPASVMAFALEVGDNPIFQRMEDTGAPVVIADVRLDPAWVPVDGIDFTRAWIGAPLLVKGQTIGQLSVFHPQPGHYRDRDGQTLLAFAQQAGVAIENARLHEETQHWANRLEVMYEVSTAAATATSLDETLQSTVVAVQQTMGADNVSLLFVEPDTGDLVIRAWVGFPEGPTLMRRQEGVGIPGWVVQTGQPALIPDVRQDSRYHGCDEDVHSELCVPLQVGQEVIGALNLESRRAAAFGQSELHLLTILAGNLATIIENSRLSEEAKARAEVLADHNRHLALLNDIAQVAASTLDMTTLVQALADTLVQIIGGDSCYITRLDEVSGQVLAEASYGPLRDSYRRMRFPSGELTLTESVLKAGQPLVVKDVFDSPYLSPRIAEMFPACSQLGLPLRVGGRNLGAVLIAFNESHSFTEEEVAWATQAVDIAALALENARLFQGVQQSKRDWEATFDAMPDLVALLDDKHRIVQTNKALADRLGVLPINVVGLTWQECVHRARQPLPSYPHTHLPADGQRHAAEVHEGRLGEDFHVSVSPIHDAGGQLAGAVLVASDITERKRAEAERERLIVELQDALGKVKTLSGLLPICASCKKIRDDKGYWHGVEAYVRDHSEAEFSHGICPDCSRELYPWFEGGEG